MVGRHIAHFKFLDALKELMAIAHFGNEYFQRKEPWKNENATDALPVREPVQDACDTILSVPSVHFREDMEDAQPGRHPFRSAAGRMRENIAIPEGHKIGKVSALFKKIEDPEIEAFGKKYLSTEKKEETKMDEANYLEFDEFKKTELRIGVIKEVAEHPKADKLYVLKVDLGEPALRQIVAGIRNYYTKEELDLEKGLR